MEASGDGLLPETQVHLKKKEPLELSRKDLLQLLGIMEGEVQAREDIIGLLKSQRSGPAVLEAQYGSAAPRRPLQALQRDGQSACRRSRENVYQKPLTQLQRLEDQQKESYRRMLEQLLLAEKLHRRTVVELDSEKRKHMDFINKSDDFTDLLEQERDRLKRLLEQEKTCQARKDREHSRRLDRVRAELAQLKSFALMLVDERQTHLEQMDQQTQKVQELSQKLQDREQRLAAAEDAVKEDAGKILRLEADLEQKTSQLTQEHAQMSTTLAEQETSSRQLLLQLSSLTQKMEDLQEHNKVLQRSEEDLQELREKISRGQCGNASLVAELESLRRRVLEMEGKDEEISRTQTQCRELQTKLQDEENLCRELRLQVDHLRKKMEDLEKLELAFNRSKTECRQVQTNLENEKQTVKDLTGELEAMKVRVNQLEAAEKKFENTELLLKDDLMKLKSLTVILVDERKNLAEKLKQEEEKSRDLGDKFKTEENKVTEVTEKLIEESKKLLKLKSEMEVQVTRLAHDKEELKTSLASKEDTCTELRARLSSTLEKMEEMEERERRRDMESAERKLGEDHKVRELSQEMERLTRRLEQLEVVEGDLMKTGDQYDLLEKRFRSEQDRANVLAKLLEESQNQVARIKKVERDEASGLEAELRSRCRTEEARSRELQADVLALKEKIHELMNKEDQLSQLQVDFSMLQQKCVMEEGRSRRLRQELDLLSAELEATKRCSRGMRPGAQGRTMLDVPRTSTGVQTDAAGAADDSTAGFIRQSVQEENHLMSNLRHQGLRSPTGPDRFPPEPPWTGRASEMFRGAGKPLRIRVTPDPGTSTATLEIHSPAGEDFFSSTTIIPTLGPQKPRITIVPQAAGVSPAPPGTRVSSPVTITTISRARSPERSRASPLSIITVSTAPVAEPSEAPGPQPTPGGRAVLRMTPDRQAASGPGRTFITTEDKKIHIHLGPQVQTSSGAVGRPGPLEPAGPEAGPKMKSSITITPVSSRPLSSSCGPVPWSLKPRLLAVSTATTVQARSEAMRIRLKKS